MENLTIEIRQGEDDQENEFNASDVKIRVYKASGKGGQHRNKVETAIELTHIPTGIKAKCDSERCKHTNQKKAFDRLRRKLDNHFRQKVLESRNRERQSQIGSGHRGDKVQTVQEQNGHVVNHVNGKKVKLKKYLKGEINLLH